MNIFKNLHEALLRLVIHVLENQRVSRYEAIFIVFLNSLLEIGLLFSNTFNYPSAQTQYVSILFTYAQFFNTTQLLQSYGFDPTSIGVLVILGVICAVLLALSLYVYIFFYRGKDANSSQKFYLWIFEQILKYVGYCLAIPFLHCFITAIGNGLAQTIIALIGVIMIAIPLLIERFFIQEDNFLETHYLCKCNTSFNLMNVLYFIFVMVFESHFATKDYRLPYTIAVFVWQIYRLWRTITVDYYFFSEIQRINVWLKGINLPIAFIFMLNYILELSNTRTLTPTEWVVLLLFTCKLVLEIHSLYERKILTNYDNLKNGSQVDHAIKLMCNRAQLIINKNAQEYDYSSSDLLSFDVLFHKGVISSDFIRSYSRKTNHDAVKLWKQEELYDPATFKFFRPQWRTQRHQTVKATPSNSIIALKHFLRQLYVSYTDKFPNNAYLHFSFASFLLHYLRLTPAVILECFLLNQHLQRQSDVRIGISRERLVRIVNTIQERLSRERSDLVFSNIDIKGIAELEDKYNEMTRLMNSYVTDYVNFLEEMSEETVYFDEVYTTGKKLLSLRKSIDTIFNKHLSENPFSMIAYSEFLRSVVSDDLTAIELNQKCQRAFARLDSYLKGDKDCFEVNLLFDKNSSIIQASGLSQNLGKILRANPACEKLFGYTIKELESMNLRGLTPRLISIQHDTFLKNYVESGRENIVYTNKRLFGRCKEGFIFPITLLVKPQIDLETGVFLFLGYLKNINTKNEFIITDQFGLIDSTSRALGEALGLTKSFLDRNLVHMQLLCPQTIDFFDLGEDFKSTNTKGKTMGTYNQTDESMYDEKNEDQSVWKRDQTDEDESRDITNNRSRVSARAKLLQMGEITFKMLKRKDPLEYAPRALMDQCKNVLEFYTNRFEERDSNKDSAETLFSSDRKYLDSLHAKMKEARQSKEYCLVQGAVEEFNTSRNKIKMYVFRFTEIEDILLDKTKKMRSRKSKNSTIKPSLKKTEGSDFVRTKTFKEDSKIDAKLSSHRPVLTELAEEEEHENQDQDPSMDSFSEDRGLNDQFEAITKRGGLPRLLNDISAIQPNIANNLDLSQDETQFPQNEYLVSIGGGPNKNFLQAHRNDSSFEVNLSGQSKDDANQKSARSSINERVSEYPQGGVRIKEPLRNTKAETAVGQRYNTEKREAINESQISGLDTNRGLETDRGLETNRGNETQRGQESNRGVDTARSRGAPSYISTDRYFEALGSHRGLLSSEKLSSIPDRADWRQKGNQVPDAISAKMEPKNDMEVNTHQIAARDANIPSSHRIRFAVDEAESGSHPESSGFEATDSMKRSEMNSNKKGISDLLNGLQQNNQARQSANKTGTGNRKKFDLKSRSSSVTSGTYKTKMIYSAIIQTYLPPEFRQSQLVVLAQLVAAILSLVIIIIICGTKFSYLQYSTGILDDVNRLVYYIHKLGSAAYDLQNNDQIVRDTPEGVAEKAATTLEGINVSLSTFTTQLYLFQQEKSYFYNTFPTFRQQILLPSVMVDPTYNIEIPMENYIQKMAYTGFDVVKNFNNIITKVDRTSIDNLIADYSKLSRLLVNWTNYFKDNESLSANLKPQINNELIAVSIILFIFTVAAIYKLFVSLKFINRTLYQLSHVMPVEYLDIKNKILIFTKNLNNKISLNSESTNLQVISSLKSKTKSGSIGISSTKHQTHKRRYLEARTFFVNRATPIFLLFSFYMILQGTFKAVMDSVITSINLGMTNILFFANDEANAIYGMSQYKNYTIQQRTNLTTAAELQNLINLYHQRIASITSQYGSAVEQIQLIFTSDQVDTLYHLIYGDVCPIYPDSNCSAVMSGVFTQGLITGRIAINDFMIRHIDIVDVPITKYYEFEELNQAEDLAHKILLDILNIASNRVQDLLDSGIELIIGLVVGLVVATVFFFWLLWSYTMKRSIEEFRDSRQLLSLLPVLAITRNSRIMSFLQKTSSLSIGRY